MEEVINLVSNYSILIVIAVLHVWDWITNKKKTSDLETTNNTILLQNAKCLEEISKSNDNIAKSLEILKNNTEKTAEEISEVHKNVLIIKSEIERERKG